MNLSKKLKKILIKEPDETEDEINNNYLADIYKSSYASINREKTQNFFLEVLDEMITNERTATKDIEERFIATVACKAAVKANMDLSSQEVDKLIQNLLILKNPYTCPHGRPTTIKLGKSDLK